MTPQEWTAVKRHVESLWGRTAKWGKYGALIKQVENVDYAEAIRVVDRHVGGYTPAPADIIGARQPASIPGKRPPLVFVPVDCGDHRLEVVDGPFGPPHRVCRNTGCDYETSEGDHDG